MAWLWRFAVWAAMQLVALILTPALPLFSEVRWGAVNNSSRVGYGIRLKPWLSWFDTPDNPITGDFNWLNENGVSYWSQVRWLYRNSLYGFKWGALAAPVDQEALRWSGDPRINRNNGRAGVYSARMGDYWEVKVVKRLVGNWGVMLSFGWLLSAYCTNTVLYKQQPKALFQFSPRFVTIK